MSRKLRTNCLHCQKPTARPRHKYCSNKCQLDYQYQKYIQTWLAGKVSGLQRHGVVSNQVKRYLREKYHNQCCLCGWAKLNVVTRRVPLVADHIDGNWQNNIESNLRLICPNCDAISSTYAALNKGRGRKNRPLSKRVQEGRLLSDLHKVPK
jgi:hypothetical protein